MWWNFFLQSHICCWLCAGICDPALLLSFAPRYFILKRISTKSRSLTLAPRALFEPTQGNTLFVGIYVGRSFSSYLKGIYCFLWFSTWFSFRSFHFALPVCQINFTFIRLCLPFVRIRMMMRWVSEWANQRWIAPKTAKRTKYIERRERTKTMDIFHIPIIFQDIKTIEWNR